MEKKSDSNHAPSNNQAAGAKPPASSKVNRKTIIIIAFLIAFVAFLVMLGPLMVSTSALIMSTVEIASHDYESAKEHLKLAIEMDPHSATAYRYRGDLYSQLKQEDKAIADYSQALKFGGGSDCNLGRGIQYHMTGRLPLALADYRIFIEKHPKNLNVLVNEADAYYRLDDLKKSLAACNLAVDEDPKDATALLNRSQCFLRMHRYKAAIDDTTVALDNLYRPGTNPDVKRDCYLMRSLSNRALGQTEEAESDLKDSRRAAHIRHKSTSEARLFEQDFSQKIVCRHFILCSNLSEPEATAIANRLEAFLTFIDTHFCHVRVDRNFRIFAFGNEGKYKAFSTEKKLWTDESPEPGASTAIEADDRSTKSTTKSWYDTTRDCVYTYALPDLNGATGSIMQKICEDLPFGDKWTKNGFASLLGKSYGYATTSACQLSLAQNLHGYSLPAQIPPLSEIINDERSNQQEATAMLAALFIFKSGKLQRYMSLTQSGEVGDYATVCEAAFDKRTAQLEPDWTAFVTELKTQQKVPEKLAAPVILSTQKDFDAFASANPALKLEPLPAHRNAQTDKTSK